MAEPVRDLVADLEKSLADARAVVAERKRLDDGGDHPAGKALNGVDGPDRYAPPDGAPRVGDD